MSKDTKNGVVYPTLLDKLGQVPTKRGAGGKETLKKRARSKWYTTAIVGGLLHLDSPLRKYYQSAWYCCHVITQREQKFTSKYCDTRVCHICNRIRTGKMINGYMKQIENLSAVDLLTLTIPNCKAEELQETINEMIRQSTLIIRVLRERRGIPINGIRKLEVTYNAEEDTYHPHFHLLIDKGGKEIISMWLKRYTDAREWAQDLRKADEGGLKELFKYTTKIQVGKLQKGKGLKVYLPQIDIIMQSLKGKRTIQPFGNIKKVDEEVNSELQAQWYTDLPAYEFVEWIWKECDWYSPILHNTLTGYVPPDIEIDLVW